MRVAADEGAREREAEAETEECWEVMERGDEIDVSVTIGVFASASVHNCGRVVLLRGCSIFSYRKSESCFSEVAETKLI